MVIYPCKGMIYYHIYEPQPIILCFINTFETIKRYNTQGADSQCVRAIAEYTILAASTTTYKGAILYQHSTIGQCDAHMTTYTQWPTFYDLHLDLRYNMHYILFHIDAVFVCF